MGRKESSNCTFCNAPKQDLIHTYIKCGVINELKRNMIKRWTGEPMSSKRWFLGSCPSSEPIEQTKDFIARQLNHFIFRCNWAGNQLHISAFKANIWSQEETELALAARLGITYDAQLKWEHMRVLLPKD